MSPWARRVSTDTHVGAAARDSRCTTAGGRPYERPGYLPVGAAVPSGPRRPAHHRNGPMRTSAPTPPAFPWGKVARAKPVTDEGSAEGFCLSYIETAHLSIALPSSAPFGGTFPTPFVPPGHFPLIGGIGPRGRLFFRAAPRDCCPARRAAKQGKQNASDTHRRAAAGGESKHNHKSAPAPVRYPPSFPSGWLPRGPGPPPR